MKFKPHPNYIKVYNTYIWFYCFIGALLSIYFFDKTLYVVISIVIQMIISLYLLNRHVNAFLKMEYSIEGKSGNSTIYSSSMLEKRYGIGTLSIGGKKYRGVHINDFEKIKNNMEG